MIITLVFEKNAIFLPKIVKNCDHNIDPWPQESKDSKRKPRMRTSLDVIKRLQWDENLPQDFFTVGYVDRFKGIVEDPFTKFSHWGDLVNGWIPLFSFKGWHLSI
jgi:hypothetical protein